MLFQKLTKYQIRCLQFEWLAYLQWTLTRHILKKIVVIGPESTGKSTLCKQLADHYQTVWCPEYAREYLLKHGTDYSFADLLTIARGQEALEAQYRAAAVAAGKKVFFVDTDMYVMKVWCEFVFGECHQWILNRAAESNCDLYLLCNTDLPWVRDELREYPDLISRQKLYHIYKDIMLNQSAPWVEIGGTHGERFETAINSVDYLLNKTSESGC